MLRFFVSDLNVSINPTLTFHFHPWEGGRGKTPARKRVGGRRRSSGVRSTVERAAPRQFCFKRLSPRTPLPNPRSRGCEQTARFALVLQVHYETKPCAARWLLPRAYGCALATTAGGSKAEKRSMSNQPNHKNHSNRGHLHLPELALRDPLTLHLREPSLDKFRLSLTKMKKNITPRKKRRRRR